MFDAALRPSLLPSGEELFFRLWSQQKDISSHAKLKRYRETDKSLRFYFGIEAHGAQTACCETLNFVDGTVSVTCG